MSDKVLMRCVSNAAYLKMGDDEILREGNYPAETLENLTVGKVYRGVAEGDYVRVWDDLDEDYLYPLNRFEILTLNS